MNIDKKKLSIQILAILGFAFTIKLAMIYHVANYEKYALSSFCSINSFIDCDGVAKTTTAQFLGIPLAYWGMLFYITTLFLTIVDKLKSSKFLKFLEVFKNPYAYITVLGSIAFGFSMILAGLSLFKLHKLCILCVATYFIDFAIALIASETSKLKYLGNFTTTITDFVDGAKKYTKTFIILLILSIGFLGYSRITYHFVPHIKKIKEFQKYANMKYNHYRAKGNTLGAENAEVVIDLYSDYVCPMCYIHNIMLHKAVKEFHNIKIVHHNYPFDKECNKYISINMHPNACFMAKGAMAAAKQGNYWEMSSLLYENQPKNVEDMVKLAEKLDFDKDTFLKDFQSPETAKELDNEINDANSLGIDSTPTMFINGKSTVGVMTYSELRDLLIQNGAKHK